MKKFAQIYNNKAHWIFETKEKPEFAPNIVLVEITGQDDIQEGWEYNAVTENFTEPLSPEPIESQSTLEDVAEETLLETKYQTLLLEMMV